MIRTFRHKGLQAFFETGSKAGIQPRHAPRLSRQLVRLDLAKTAGDMNVPGWQLHPLSGNLAGHYSVTVSGNWRITFRFEGEDAVLVDYQDYHLEIEDDPNAQPAASRRNLAGRYFTRP